MYGLALPFWNCEPTLIPGSPPCQQHELFILARNSLECELDSPNLWTMQACLLILHDTPPSEWSFESARTWTLSAQAVACAQQIGLHRDPGTWKLATWEKRLRKKLWWATFTAHTWTAITNGNPVHIHAATYTTSELSVSDISSDEEVSVDFKDSIDDLGPDMISTAKFLQQVKLAQITHQLLNLALYVPIHL